MSYRESKSSKMAGVFSVMFRQKNHTAVAELLEQNRLLILKSHLEIIQTNALTVGKLLPITKRYIGVGNVIVKVNKK